MTTKAERYRSQIKLPDEPHILRKLARTLKFREVCPRDTAKSGGCKGTPACKERHIFVKRKGWSR